MFERSGVLLEEVLMFFNLELLVLYLFWKLYLLFFLVGECVFIIRLLVLLGRKNVKSRERIIDLVLNKNGVLDIMVCEEIFKLSIYYYFVIFWLI